MSMPIPEPVPAAPRAAPSASEIASWILAALALFLVLQLHLVAALCGGLAVYELVRLLAEKMPFVRSRRETGKLLVLAILAAAIIAALALATLGVLALFRSGHGSLPALLTKMADIVGSSKEKLPDWLASELPTDTDEMKDDLALWLREHSGALQAYGAEIGRLFLHALIGMILGALISLGGEARHSESSAPLSRALGERAARLALAFRRIIFAQVRISALNTVLTALYLVVILPILGIHLPFTKTLIALTFLAGLLPVVGNLISNSIIVIVSLAVSLGAAIGSLAFLLVIHKLEYFVNARIVGAEIKARAWELLLVILVMEAAFGIAGVIAGPIYYAYLKDELSARDLI